MRATLPLTALMLLLGAFAGAFVPSGLAQAHDHETSTGVVIAHDLPANGRTYVGNLNHFVVLYLGDDAIPDFHQQNQVRVLLNDVVVFETTDDSGHDYDGVYGFDVTFLATGNYRVEAAQEGTVKAHFEGWVEEPNSDVIGTPEPDVLMFTTAPVLARSLQLIMYAALQDGAPIAHSDTVFEAYTRGNNLLLTPTGDTVAVESPKLMLRIKTHTHEDDLQAVAATFAPGNYTGRIQTYRSFPSSGIDFQPGVATIGLGASPNVGLTPQTSAAPLPDNVVVTARLGDLTLMGTFDPYNVVGPDTLMHLAVSVLDANRTPVQHVNFVAELIGPDGSVLLASETLHEYDGILEIETVQSVPGAYVLRVTADRGMTGSIDLPYTVSPAAPALGQGPQIVTVTGTDAIEVGKTADLVIHIADLAGNPYQHNEVDVVIDRQINGVDELGVPVLRAKLHTHADGDFPLKVAFQEPGWYRVRMSPYPLGAQAAPQFWLDEVGNALAFDVAVKEGTFPGPSTPKDEVDGVAQESPMSAAFVLLALGLAVAVIRRR